MMPEIKLPKIPDRKPVKLVVEILPDLAQALDDYADVYGAAYGQREKPGDLVPYMLWSFLESDRAFMRSRSKP
jgi:hypothetical protein